MAIENLKSDLRTLLSATSNSELYNTIANILGSSWIHVVQVNVQESADLMKTTCEGAILQHYQKHPKAKKYANDITEMHLRHFSAQFDKTIFGAAILKVIKSYNQTFSKWGNTSRYKRSALVKPQFNAYKDTNQIKPTFIVDSPGWGGNYPEFLQGFRSACFNEWSKLTKGGGLGTMQEPSWAPADAPAQPGWQKEDPHGAKEKAWEGIHDPVTIYPGWVILRAEELQMAFSFSKATYDLPKMIIRELGIDMDETPENNKGAFEQLRKLKLKLGPTNLPEVFDGKEGIRMILIHLMDIQSALRRGIPYINPKEAAEVDASPTFKQQAAAAAQYKLMRDIMLKNKKYVALKKVKTKNPSTKPRKATLKKSQRNTKVAFTKVILPSKINVSGGGKEKGQGKQASTSQAADLARLKKYIQGRLPAEVRRNMGRPVLQNRTGRFSNSVQLLSLTEAKNSLMAKYTYLLSPYETFENKGKKRWPMAYNPKPLIAKSIRNLAQGRIEQKLTVRRV